MSAALEAFLHVICALLANKCRRPPTAAPLMPGARHQGYPNAKILQFDESGISQVQFEETEQYAITRDFLNNYPRRLEQLFADE